MGSRADGASERPRAVSEYLVDRMIGAGVRKLCFVVSPGKWDILRYYGGAVGPADIAYVVQSQPAGLCDAIFRAVPLIPRETHVAIGLPDTIWFPEDGLARLPDGALSFLLFPVAQPQFFDAVVIDDRDGAVREIQVKSPSARSNWIWGAFKMPGTVLHALHHLWLARERRDEYIGTLVNAFIAEGGFAVGVRAGEAYVDVGTLHGYREALALLGGVPNGPTARQLAPAGNG